VATRFRDRSEAGRLLADRLSEYRGRDDLLVLALPRGGIPVGYEIARALEAPLDVFVVRKLGVPGHEELALGAIATNGVRVLNQRVVNDLGITEGDIARVAAREADELNRREEAYREGRPSPQIAGRTVILVDDGLATGSTMRAAVAALRAYEPAEIVVAVPVGAAQVCGELEREADKVVCAMSPEPMAAISMWYDDFSQTTDAEVRELLHRSRSNGSMPPAGVGVRDVVIPTGPATVEGSLTLPAGAKGVVLFAHGSGSSRHSPRNRYVARELNDASLATLLIDLLTPGEEEVDLRTRELRFDIGLLAERLVGATRWLTESSPTGHLEVGYFGASTGAGAALVAAAELPEAVGAVVSRGGRPDLAGDALEKVRAPTLLIVGGEDVPVIGMNRSAQDRLSCETRLEIVDGASHLFEEPGALERVAALARDWFVARIA
jgi:putative phosphoribosyl transferase